MKVQKVLVILASACLLTSCSTYWEQVRENYRNIDTSPRHVEGEYVDVYGRIYDKDGNFVGRIDR